MHINTADNQVIDQKTTYIDASYWIEANDIDGYKSVGSPEKPLALGIRGRGNSSWTYDKKTYKLKLDKKTALFGMSKSKHWALLNHFPGQEALTQNVSFELGKRLGLAWTPANVAVEVMLNGHNIGVYYLTETVRIESERVDIFEQPDQNTDPLTVAGGWLIEIDNYEDPCQITVTQDKDGEPFDARFTYHTPEDLSELQLAWLQEELTTLTERIYTPDKSDNSWAEMIDIESLARYYLVQELTNNRDAFIGSTYLYKDTGGKWTFGPLWDCGWTFDDDNRQYTSAERRRQLDPFVHFTWIEELWKFPYFRNYVCDLWTTLSPGLIDGMDEFIDSFISHIEKAFIQNYDVIWKTETYSIDFMRDTYTRRLHEHYNWMNRYISSTIASVQEIGSDNPEVIKVIQIADGTIKIAGCSTDIVRVEVTGSDGRIFPTNVISATTARIEAPAGLYIVRAFTVDRASLPAKFMLR